MEKYKLKEHQLYALAMLESNPSLLIAFEMGCGKTAIALTYIYKHIKRGDAKDALVICPASLVGSWEQAIEDMIRFEGFDAHAVKLLKERVTIRSFQKTYKTVKATRTTRSGEQQVKKTHPLREDVDKQWSILVVDEAHQCSAHNAVQTKAAITLARLSGKIISLTATPLHGGGGKPNWAKAYGEIQVLTRGEAYRNWSDFCTKAVTMVDRWHNPTEFNEPYCKRVFEEHSIVCRLEDCVDMPPVSEQYIKCPLAEKAVYKDLADGRYEKYGLEITVAGAQYIKMMQVVSGSMKVDSGNTMQFKTSKDDALKDLLEGTGDAVVIFCTFRASLARCAEVAKKAGRKPMIYAGGSIKDSWKDFQNGKYDTIICQYQSGSAGLNLQRAHIMIMYEPTRSSLLLKQALGRIYRMGQDKKVIYHYLYTMNTIEKRAWDVVRSGKDLSDELLEEWSIKGVR